MYSVTIRDHAMIAHSLPHPAFGPAQQLHGATYIADAEFSSPALNDHQIVIDIGLAHQLLSQALEPLRYQNLDTLPEFAGALTTTEYLAAYVHRRLCSLLGGRFQGRLKVTLHESHVASAAYEAPAA
ncbi:MAG: 6-carboxytetrahydropterin synthase [Bacteroidia bacterium]|nr:6-carboxytetrahydropterin synthase [Bacteroidia bacterium]